MNDTTDITLPSGGTVTLRDWISARQEQIIFSSIAQYQPSQGEIRDGANFPYEAVIAHQNATLEQWVTAVNGDTTDILNKILDLKSSDVKYIMDSIEAQGKVDAGN